MDHDQQQNSVDGGGLSGKKSMKKTSHPIGNSSGAQQRRASLGSSGKVSSPKKKEGVIPHYLRASTGSCHDFCKYGKRLTVEEKPWHSFSKRVAKTSSSKLSDVKHRPGENRTNAEDLNPSPDKTISKSLSEIINNEVELSPDKLETAKDVVLNRSPDETISQNSSEIMMNEVSLPAKEVVMSPEKLETTKYLLNPSPDTMISQNSSEIIKSEVYLPLKEFELSPDKLETAKGVLETESKTAKMPSVHAPLLQPKAVIMKASPHSETSEGNLRKVRINSKIKDGKLPQASKPSYVSQGQLRTLKHSDMKDRKILAETKASQKGILRSSDNPSSSMVSTNKTRNLTSRKNNNSKMVSLNDPTITRKAVNAKQLKNDKVTVKTLNNLETGTVKSSPKPIRRRVVLASSNKHDQIEEDAIVCNHHNWEEEEEEGERDDEESRGMDNSATKLIPTNKDESKGKKKEGAEGKITRTLRKGTTMKNNDSSPMKLNFRRGKVVQLLSDNNTPRRLKFRRGLTLLLNKDIITDVKKISKKKGVVDDKDAADPISKKVVLRHQDLQDKKIDPGLFNNVIEETASKLAGSRKSKVKALVGAFETVISLQESKAPTNAVS